MAITTCEVEGTVYGPRGEILVGATVTAKLSRYDVFGPIVVPITETSITDSVGHFSLNLWPNSLGVRKNTSYTITISHASISTQTITDIIVPNQATVTLAELLGWYNPESIPIGTLFVSGGSLSINGQYLAIG